MFSKTLLLLTFISSFAYAQAPVSLTFPTKNLRVSLSWLVGPMISRALASGDTDPNSQSIMVLQWSGDPGSFRVDASMDMGGQTMNAPSPTLTADRPGRFRSSGLYFEMLGAWNICVVLHPEAPDKETSCTAILLR